MTIVALKTLIAEVEADASADENLFLAFLKKVKTLVVSKIQEIESNVGNEVVSEIPVVSEETASSPPVTEVTATSEQPESSQ